MQHASILGQFSRLTTLLRCSREQHDALLHGDFEDFADLLDKRGQEIEALRLAHDDSQAPSNVSVLPTSLTERERRDDELAIQILLRTIAQQDERNEALLGL